MAGTTFNRDTIAAIKAAAVFRPKSPIPYGVMNLVEDELHRLQDLQVITPVDCSEWQLHCRREEAKWNSEDLW